MVSRDKKKYYDAIDQSIDLVKLSQSQTRADFWGAQGIENIYSGGVHDVYLVGLRLLREAKVPSENRVTKSSRETKVGWNS